LKWILRLGHAFLLRGNNFLSVYVATVALTATAGRYQHKDLWRKLRVLPGRMDGGVIVAQDWRFVNHASLL
jgi:hypothetical protein